MSACASGGVPRPEPFPRPGEPGAPATVERPEPPAADRPAPERPPMPAPLPALEAGGAIVERALELRGRPYAPGASGPDRFDCSGLVQYVFSGAGISLPRTVDDQFAATLPIDAPSIAPGDLLFFRISSRRASHVGIAIGDGTFIHAPSARGVVRVERLDAEYWRRRFEGARRLGKTKDER